MIDLAEKYKLLHYVKYLIYPNRLPKLLLGLNALKLKIAIYKRIGYFLLSKPIPQTLFPLSDSENGMSLPIKSFTLSALILMGLVANQVGFAACRTSPIHEAFNVEALKSEMMVTALSCKAQDQYNEFIGNARPVINLQELKIKNYFHKMYGHGGQKAQDDYVTQLSNIQSSQGLKSGTVFCLQRMDMFKEVKPLKTATELSQYAEAKDIAQPTSFEVCQAPSYSKGHKVSKKRHIAHKTTTHKK